MIRQDRISQMYIVLAMMLTVYLATFENTTLILFPGLLLTFGLVMEFYLEKKREETPARDKGSLKEIAFYTVMALLGFYLTSFGVSQLPMSIQLPTFTALAYVILMAIAEEQFFRGFITDLFLAKLSHPYQALLMSGTTFAIYHIARYGTQADAMIYVFAGGIILSWVAYKSRRLSPGMNGHIINNVRSLLGV